MSDDNETTSGINASDLILRDSSGERKLRTNYVKEFDDTVRCLPMTKAAKETYIQPIAEQAAVVEAIDNGELDPEEFDDDEAEEIAGLGLGSEEMASLFDEHYPEGKASPDLVAAYRGVWENSDEPEFEGEFDGLDAFFVDEVLDSDYELPLFYGVLLASGMDEAVDEHRNMMDAAVNGGDVDEESEQEGDEGK